MNLGFFFYLYMLYVHTPSVSTRRSKSALRKADQSLQFTFDAYIVISDCHQERFPDLNLLNEFKIRQHARFAEILQNSDFTV